MNTSPYAPYDATSPYGWSAPQPAPEPSSGSQSSRRLGTLALALALMVGSGAAGAGLALGLDDDGTTPVRAAAVIAQSSGESGPTVAGTTESAAAIIGPSVVTIRVAGSQTTQTPFGTRQQRVSGTGSGVVLSTDGYIVTNNHVVASAVGGGEVSVLFRSGRTAEATIVGTDPTSDLAVIKVPASDELTPAVFADSDDLVVGQDVLAVGAPLGLSNTITEGIISTIGRPVRTGEPGASAQSVIDAIQTDAAINPGNSGGALANLAGEVVGLNTAIATAGGSSGSIGVGFAIPSNTVVEVARELIADGTAEHPLLGVSVSNGPNASGALVRDVRGAAAGAGLRAGDIITKVDDRTVVDANSLIVAVRAHDPGDKVVVSYLRGGQTRTTTVALTTAPAE